MREILFRAKAINRDKGYHRSNYKNGDWVYGLITRLYDERFENLPAEMNYIGTVFWQEWRGVWAVCGKGTSRGCNQDVYVYSRNPNRVEVIGNIFDNADLLKGE